MDLSEILQELKDKTKWSDKRIGNMVGLSQPQITKLRIGSITDTHLKPGLLILKLAKEEGIIKRRFLF